MKWKYHINIKKHFTNETTPELIENLSKLLLFQLKRINKAIENSDIEEDYKYYALDEMEMIIDNFEFLELLANGEIKKEEWNNFDFDGDYESLFNEYLTMLYDLGDTKIHTRKGYEKLIWID